jgi:hypothetical protein
MVVSSNMLIMFLFLLQPNRWEIEDIKNPEDMVWSIAKERYKGSRSSLSGTWLTTAMKIE